MSDNPDNGLAEDEETTRHLFALLYPDEESSSSIENPRYEDADELNDFRSLLGQFRDMPDEEPSAAVSNKLLALAAKHAPAEKKEEGQGFFARLTDWLLPAVYHPGLASAATLVLVAGLAGTLYVNGKSQVAEPQTATRAEAPRSELPNAASPLAQEALGTARLGDDRLADPAAAADSPVDVLVEPDSVATANEEETADDESLAESDRAREDGFARKKKSKELADESSAFKAEAKRDRALDGTLGGVVGGEGVGEGGVIGGAGKGGGGLDFSSGAKSSTTKNEQQRSARPGDANQKSSDSRSDAKSESPKKARPVVKTPPRQPVTSKDKAPAPKPSRTRDSSSSNKSATPAAEPEPAPAADPAPPPAPPTATITGSAAEETKPAAPPRGKPAGDEDDDADDAGGAEEEQNEAPAEKPAESKVDPAARAAALHKQAITAAKKNQCDKVKALGQTIRKLSSSYYDRTFLSDKQLTACLAPAVKK